MNNLKNIIGKNLLNLRKNRKLTQISLAKELNVSDKAVSRWERGEAMPEIDALLKCAEYFSVTLDYFVKEDHEIEDEMQNIQVCSPENSRVDKNRKLTISLLWISSIWIIASIVFGYYHILFGVDNWQIFVWAVPISLMTFIVFNKFWSITIKKGIFYSIFLWSFLLCIYLQVLEHNLWFIFLAGFPIQISIFLFAKLKND